MTKEAGVDLVTVIGVRSQVMYLDTDTHSIVHQNLLIYIRKGEGTFGSIIKVKRKTCTLMSNIYLVVVLPLNETRNTTKVKFYDIKTRKYVNKVKGVELGSYIVVSGRDLVLIVDKVDSYIVIFFSRYKFLISLGPSKKICLSDQKY